MLSNAMNKALIGAETHQGFGVQLSKCAKHTYAALERRKLTRGGWLTGEGIKARELALEADWIERNIECQSYGEQLTGLDSDTIAEILTQLNAYHYIDRANYNDEYDMARWLRDANVEVFDTVVDFARNNMEGVYLPSFVEIDWEATGDNLLGEVTNIELSNGAVVTFIED